MAGLQQKKKKRTKQSKILHPIPIGLMTSFVLLYDFVCTGFPKDLV